MTNHSHDSDTSGDSYLSTSEFLKSLSTFNNHFEALKKFNKAAANYLSGSGTKDVIKSFLDESIDGLEVITFLEARKYSAAEYATIFESLESILLRITGNDPSVLKYHSVGLTIVRRILQLNMKNVYFLLSGNNNATHNKCCLKLLASMVAFSNQSAWEVAAVFNFAHPSLSTILNRRDIRDAKDVRGCLILFMCAFLMSNDNNVIKQVVLQKGFLNGVFPGLIFDKSHILHAFLYTIKSKILENSNIQKTLKVKLVNDNTLLQIVNLYNWNGPRKMKGSNYKGSRNTKVVNKEPDCLVSEEEKYLVSETAHGFLITSLCSVKNGIIFHDKTFGTSGRNHNHLVFNILKSLDHPYNHSLMSDLILKVLCACPDQVKPYLNLMKDQISDPRSSQNWIQLVKLITKLVDVQEAAFDMLKSTESFTSSKMVAVIVNLTLPHVISKQVSTAALIHQESSVRAAILDYLLTALKKMKLIFDKLTDNLIEELQETLLPLLPDVETVMMCWKLTNQKPENALNSRDDISLVETMVNIIETISSYQIVCPHSFTDQSIDFNCLLNNIKDAEDEIAKEQSLNLQLSVLKILSHNQQFQVLSSSNIISLLVEISLSEISELSISALKILSGIIRQATMCHSDFIFVWIRKLKSCCDAKLIRFVTESILSTINQISVKEVDAEVTGEALFKKLLSLNDNTIDESMQNDLDSMVKATLELLKSNEYKDKNTKQFVSSVLNSLIHYSGNPETFCSHLKAYSALLTQDLRDYLKIWTAGLPPKNNLNTVHKVKKKEKQSFQKILQEILVSNRDFQLIVDTFEDYVSVLAHDDGEEIISQILLYLSISMKTVKGDNEIQGLCDIIIKLAENHITSTSVLEKFLSHSVIQMYFLGENCSKPISKMVICIIKSCGFQDSSTLNGFSITAKNFIISSTCNVDLSFYEDVIDCFIGLFSSDTCIEITVAVSESPLLNNIDVSILCSLMKKCFENANPHELVLNGSVMSKIAVRVSNDSYSELMSSFLMILEEIPMYCLALPTDVLKSFLSNVNQFSLSVCKTLIASSSLHLIAFHDWFHDGNLNDENKADFITVIVVYLKQFDHLQADDQIYLYNMYWPLLKCYLVSTELRNCDYKCINELVRQFCRFNIISSKHLQEVTETVIEHVNRGIPVPSNHLPAFVELLKNRLHDLVEILMVSICHLYDDSSDAELCSYFETCLSVIKDASHQHQIDLNSETLFKIIKVFLKNGLKDNKHGPDVLRILFLILSDEDVVKKSELSISNVYSMIVNHSQFLPVMLDDHSKEIKEMIVDLLLCLVQRDSSICDDKHIPVYLAAYSASFSHIDQKLLRLMYVYETDGHVDLHQYQPYLWGNKAITHYSLLKNVAMSLWKQPKFEEVIELLDTERIVKSAMKFPLDLSLMMKDYQTDMIEEDSDLYDPRFLFPLFSHLLSPESLVHYPKFIEKGCLSYILASLSSHDKNVRSVAYYLLECFYGHLEGARRFRNRHIFLLVLDVLKNGINTPNLRLPNIVTVFLAKVCLIFYNADDMMYQPLYNFMTIRPYFDVWHVPEFYKLHFSEDITFSNYRFWLLTLLSQSVRGNIDFYVCERRHIFLLLLTFFNSNIYDNKSKNLVLEILCSASRSSNAAVKLVRHYNLIGWAQSLVTESDAITKNLIKLIFNIWNSLIHAKSSVDEKKLLKHIDEEDDQQEITGVEEGDGQCNGLINSEDDNLEKWKFVGYQIIKLVTSLIRYHRYNVTKDEFNDSINCTLKILECYKEMESCTIISEDVLTFIDVYDRLFRQTPSVENEDLMTRSHQESFTKLVKLLLFWRPNLKQENDVKCLQMMIDFLAKNVNLLCVDIWTSILNWIRDNFREHEILEILFRDQKKMLHSLISLTMKSILMFQPCCAGVSIINEIFSRIVPKFQESKSAADSSSEKFEIDDSFESKERFVEMKKHYEEMVKTLLDISSFRVVGDRSCLTKRKKIKQSAKKCKRTKLNM